MMRWVFNIFALLSFLLCVATVVLWVRSYKLNISYRHDITHRDDVGKPDTTGWYVKSHSGYMFAGEFLWYATVNPSPEGRLEGRTKN